ncbi:hypothetical protein NHX12_022394 [Muraenolepis orangiensis]|uniref:WD repeat-containing protein 11 n=1 Tax=Muraenolepis orangiensis TaxID=630683 RepID=A0A9Q0IV30_9TELE|nr:hypothetical protein NHX12_022394 [Muraenolepis orangiensis]
MIPYTVNIKLAARTLTGTLNLQNKPAVDWGWQGLIAQGCHSSILIIDPKTTQTIQVLERHKANVVKVKWSRENYHHSLSSPYSLRLASGDASGKIIVWDVVSGTAHCEIQEHSKPIQDLEWLWNQDASRDLLLAVHPPNYVVLWNGDTGTKLWKKSYAENILSFSFDPFDPANMACTFTGTGKKVYIASPHASPAHSKPAPAPTLPAPTGAKKALNKVKVLITNEKPTQTLINRERLKWSQETLVNRERLELRLETLINRERLKWSQETLINRARLELRLETLINRERLKWSQETLINRERLKWSQETLVNRERLEWSQETLINRERLELRLETLINRERLEWRQERPINGERLVWSHETLISRERLEWRQERPISRERQEWRRERRINAETGLETGDTDVLSYLPSKRNHMLLLYPREILILDLELSQTVIPCAQRDALYCLHENGCITLRVCRSTTANATDEAAEQSVQELVYDLRSQCDAIRVTKTVRPYRMVICPVSENSAALTISDGRVMLSGLSPLYSPVSFCGAPLAHNQKRIQDLSLNTMIGQTLITGEALSSSQQEVQLKFLLTGLLSGLPLPPFSIRMCPPLTTKNINHYQPLLAVSEWLLYHQPLLAVGERLLYHQPLLAVDLSEGHCGALDGDHGLVTTPPLVTTPHGLVTTPPRSGDHAPTGCSRCFAFRGDRGTDEPAIEMIKVSHLKQYLVVVFRDKPLELWDIRTGTLLREMAKNFPTVTALEWSPSHNLKSLKKKQMAAREAMARQTVSDAEQSSVESSVISMLQDAESKCESSQAISAREHFVFTDTDGQVYHITVEGNMVKDGARIPPDGSMGSIACIAWKGDTLVLGDVDGNLNFWDLKARLSRGIPTHRGWVKKIRFAPGKGNQKLLVMYTDGAEVWDTKDVQMVSSMRIGRNVNYRVLDIDWCTSDKVVLASDDGCIRVLEMAMKSASYRMDEQDLTDPVWCPYLLLPRASFTLKAFLLLQPWSGTFTMDISQVDYNEKDEIKGLIQEQLNSLSNDMKSVLQDPELSLLQRCLLVSRLFGDESDLQFWTVASHYLQSFARARQLSVPATAGGQPQSDGGLPACQNYLDICHDTLCESSYFQKFQLDRVHLQEVKRSSYEHTKKCADQLLLLGQTDRAVQLLLETSAENSSYYCDSLKACLVTTITSSGPSQSTIKLVATNMIANGKLAEGVQLLCLIDKAADACRYLQTYGEWNRASWLAKVRLNPAESSDVLKRWAEHLCSPQVNQKSKAMLVLLSLGCFHKVGEMLLSMRYFDRAALFIEACLKCGVMEANDSTNILLICAARPPPSPPSQCGRHRHPLHSVVVTVTPFTNGFLTDTPNLIGVAFTDYARTLRTLGLREGAALWASRAGSAGEELMEELFRGEGDQAPPLAPGIGVGDEDRKFESVEE